jgi:hypothetical protein
MISRMPVLDGEKVVSLFLAQQSQDYVSFVYATALWAPIPYVVHGEYNDYGAVHNFTGKSDAHLVEYFKENAIKMGIGENEYHDIEISEEKISSDGLEFIYSADHENRLQFSDYRKNKLLVKHVVIRESLYNKVLSDYSFSNYQMKLGAKKTDSYVSEDHEYVRVNFAYITQDWENQSKKIIELLREQLSEEKNMFGMRDDYLIRTLTQDIYDHEATLPALQWLSGASGGRGESAGWMPPLGFWSKFSGMSDADAADYLYEFLKFAWFNRFVWDSRITWFPSCNASQDSDMDAQVFLANYMKEEARSLIKERIEDDWEFDPDQLAAVDLLDYKPANFEDATIAED